MFDIAIGILIGAFIGWHFPEPFWAKIIKEKVVAVFIKSKD
jgi:Na+/H+-dicarboxylate symporter